MAHIDAHDTAPHLHVEDVRLTSHLTALADSLHNRTLRRAISRARIRANRREAMRLRTIAGTCPILMLSGRTFSAGTRRE